jgi:hypothetical protein
VISPAAAAPAMNALKQLAAVTAMNFDQTFMTISSMTVHKKSL